MTLDESTTT